MTRPIPSPRPARSGAAESGPVDRVAPTADGGPAHAVNRSGHGETNRPPGPYEARYDIRYGYGANRTIIRP